MWKKVFYAPPESEEDEEHEEEQNEESNEEEETPPWKEDIEKVGQQFSEFRAQMTATLNALAENAKKKEEPEEESEETPKDLWALTKQMPELTPELIRAELKNMMKGEVSGLKNEIQSMLSIRDSDRALLNSMSQYEDDIKDGNSEILRATPEARKLIEPLLDPSIRGTPQHDKLAFLVAAASKPKAIAKRETARIKAEEETRNAARDRASALGGAGGRGIRNQEAKITPEDEAVCETLGINLKDEKVRARILESKKTEKLEGLHGSNLTGGIINE